MSPERISVGEEGDGQSVQRNQRQTSSTWSFASVTINNSSGGRITGLKGGLILTCSWHSKARQVQCSTGAGLSASRPETRDNISRGKLHPAIHTDCTDIHHTRRHGIISHEANSILLFTLTVQTFITPGDMG